MRSPDVTALELAHEVVRVLLRAPLLVDHGLPYDLPLGIRMYSPVRHSGVTIQRVSPDRRSTFTDHKLRSRDDAEDLVIALEKGEVE